jgi:hypothetical protein
VWRTTQPIVLWLNEGLRVQIFPCAISFRMVLFGRK